MTAAGIRLSNATLAAAGERVGVPEYDRDRIMVGVVHVGVGGFHRSHQAMYHDRLLREGKGFEWGICGVGVLPGDRRMKEVMRAQDCLYTLVVKRADGTREQRVMGSIVDYLFAPDERQAVVERMAAPMTRIVSLTITEGGYTLDHIADGQRHPAFELIVDALRSRRDRGIAPFAVMSCDNLPANGDVARSALMAFARLRDPDLAAWIAREVYFPNSMVDRITPATTDADREQLRSDQQIEDAWPVVCEEYESWVLEDAFPAGHPPYADAGITMVGDVWPYELMKLRLLNAGHQVIAYFGRLAGFEYVHEAAQDPVFRAFLRGYMDVEAEPTLAPTPFVDLDAYKDTLLDRFANPEIRDTLARICAETSDRIPKFLLPVVADQLASGGEIKRSAAAVASWARYAEGVDENRRPFEVIDRLAETLTRVARSERDSPDSFLSIREVFGEVGTHERFVAAYRAALDLLHEHGARATLLALT